MERIQRAFVVMPFDPGYARLYADIFSPALLAAGFGATRGDDLYEPGEVMTVIQRELVHCDLVLCELSGRNPNVMYELGLAHALGKPTILVSNREGDVPFDLRHRRVFLYDRNAKGWERRLGEQVRAAAASVRSGDMEWPAVLATPAARSAPERPAAGAEPGTDPRVVDRPMNLGFDGPIVQGAPFGWFDSTGHVSGVSSEYRLHLAPRGGTDPGRCVTLESPSPAFQGFGSLMQRCRAAFLRGRSVRLEGELRCDDVDGWAGLWLRVDGIDQPNLFFDNMSGRPIRGTMPWGVHRVEAVVPAEGEWLNYGIVLSGGGRLWADNLRLLAWDPQGTWQEA